MQVIPVIDIRGGVVVAARGGARDTYAPISTPLADGCGIVQVAGGLLRLFAFPTLYVADLDGIAGRAPDHGALEALHRAFPRLTLMVDDGAATPARIGALRALGALPVVGTETLPDAARLDALREAAGGPGALALSLDYFGGAYRGPAGLDAAPARWPDTVIAMTLAAVGMDRGPDLATVRRIAAAARPHRRVIAAGGVRDKADIRALEAAGAAGVLVASALHAQKLRAGDLAEVTGP